MFLFFVYTDKNTDHVRFINISLFSYLSGPNASFPVNCMLRSTVKKAYRDDNFRPTCFCDVRQNAETLNTFLMMI